MRHRNAHSDFLSYLLPMLVGTSLLLPVVSFEYMYDDFLFLHQVRAFRMELLLPQAGEMFYRPVSTTAYFALLNALGSRHPAVAHYLSLSIALLAIGLCVAVGRAVAGRVAGMLSGTLFASWTMLPVLVGWTSGIQDLLAVTFVLTALLLRLKGLRWWSRGAFLCALLSKESAAPAVLAILAADFLTASSKRAIVRAGLWDMGILFLWAAVHPGVLRLFSRGTQDTIHYTGLVGLPALTEQLGRYLSVLANLPVARIPITWPSYYGAAYGTALGAVLAIALVQTRLDERRRPLRAVYIIAGLLVAGPLLVAAGAVRIWVPYYVSIAVLGTSLLGGSIAARGPFPVRAILLMAFLTASVWTRGAEFIPKQSSDPGLRRMSQMLETVRLEFLRVQPTLPRGAQVLVSFSGEVDQDVVNHLIAIQALRIWYDNDSLQTRRAFEREKAQGSDFLYWVGPGLDVHRVDTMTLTPPDGIPAEEEYYDYLNAILGYCRGLAATGEGMRAAHALGRIPFRDGPTRQLGLRFSAVLLSADGEEASARAVLATAAPLPRRNALTLAFTLFRLSVRGVAMDAEVLRACGLDVTDRDALVYLAKRARAVGDVPLALRLERHLSK